MTILMYIAIGIGVVIVFNRIVIWYQRKYPPNYKNIQLAAKVVDEVTKQPVGKAEILIQYIISKGRSEKAPVEERSYTDFNGDVSLSIEQIAIDSDGITITISAKGYKKYTYRVNIRSLNDNTRLEKKRVLMEKI